MPQNFQVTFEEEIISLQKINQNLILPYKEVLRKRSVITSLQIHFLNDNLNRIDELFYAYILLIAKQSGLRQILLKFNTKNEAKPLNIARQYAGQLFKKPNSLIVNIYNQSSPLTPYFKGSKDFLPLLYINSTEIGTLFGTKRNKINIQDFIDRLIRDGNSDAVFDKIKRKDDFAKALNEALNETEIFHYAWRYMFRAFGNINILRVLLIKSYNDNKNIGASIRKYNEFSFGGITIKNTATKFSNEIIDTLNKEKFFEFSYLEIFLFSIIVLNSQALDIGKSGFKFDENKLHEFKSFKEKYLKHIIDIIDYTRRIKSGLDELANNIEEHSGRTKNDGEGVIFIRVLSSEGFKELSDESNEAFSVWTKATRGTNSNYMHVNIVDIGVKSIRDTYKENVKSEIDSLKKENPVTNQLIIDEFGEDYQELEKEGFDVGDLFDFTKIKFNHQINRVAARLGLLIFSDLIIREKSGIIKIGTFGVDGKPFNSYLKYDNNAFINDKEDITNVIQLGTNYAFTLAIKDVFSIKKEKKIKTKSQTPMSSEVSIFTDLFNYQFGTIADDFSGKTALLECDISTIKNLNKYDKISAVKSKILGAITKVKNAKDTVVVLDASKNEKILKNSSDWLRLMATLQLANPEKDNNVIVYNIDERLHQSIITINKYFDKSKKGFWAKNDFIVFYVNVTHDGLNFYFNDVLNGATYKEYINLNKSIANYHFNMQHFDSKNKDAVTPITNFRNTLFSNGKLLNFELLLKNKEGLSLFEKTAQAFLKLEIKDKI